MTPIPVAIATAGAVRSLRETQSSRRLFGSTESWRLIETPPGGLGQYHIWFDRASGDIRVDLIPDAAFYKTHEPALLDE